MDIVRGLFEKHGKIIKYLFCSVASAVIEMAIGWIFLRMLSDNILVVNTCSIIIGAVAHYILTLLFVFHQDNSWKSIFVYVVTFFFGMLLQNAVIWLFYGLILQNAHELIRYVFSKGFSLAIPFVAIYYVRNRLNAKLSSDSHD